VAGGGRAVGAEHPAATAVHAAAHAGSAMLTADVGS